VERLGYKAIWLTVDAVVAGNRERDVKSAWESLDPQGDIDMGGTAGKLLSNNDLDMTWEEVGLSLLILNVFVYHVDAPQTIPWLRRVTKLPIVLKGASGPISPILIQMHQP
jgi:L-lactate dehydrogenase (cytochrome)